MLIAPIPTASRADCFAHSLPNRPSDEWKRLAVHAREVGELAAEFADIFGWAGMARAAGLLHDAGKASAEFQQYIRGQGGSVDHSTKGARIANSKYNELPGRILALCIAGHHAGLPDPENLDRRLDPRNIIPDAADWIDHITTPPQSQREASIADQLEVCRRYLRQLGWNEVATHEDKAISGASRFRPGFQALLSDAEKRRFDVFVCEAVDRLGHKLADVADFYDRLTFFGVDVHAVCLGLVTQMHIGIRGTMARLTLSDLRAKTIRGQLGRARLGRIPGGLAYGYDIIAPSAGSDGAGERRINADEARAGRPPDLPRLCGRAITSTHRAPPERRQRSRVLVAVPGVTRPSAVMSTVAPAS